MLQCLNSTAPGDLDGTGGRIWRAMFAARKSVFVDLLKWNVPVVDGRYEMDQFDDEYASYLVVADRGGGHVASARLLSTTRPHILDSLFPQLCEHGVPSGAGIREITRFCIDRGLDRKERRQARDCLVHALARHALTHAIHTYTAVAEASWCEQILAFGWDCALLGPAQRIDGELLAAVQIQIDARTPGRLARAGIEAPPERQVGDTLPTAAPTGAQAAPR